MNMVLKGYTNVASVHAHANVYNFLDLTKPFLIPVSSPP